MNTRSEAQCIVDGHDVLVRATEYAQSGWLVFPVHTVRSDGVCTCRDRYCASIGKHPRDTYNQKNPITDLASVNYQFGSVFFGECNIGIATGAVSWLVVLDFDGERGDEQFKALRSATLTAVTGRGHHMYFQHPGRAHTIRNRREILPGVDVRADGGYVVAPPSIHASGRSYRWLNPGAEVLPLPKNLLALVK